MHHNAVVRLNYHKPNQSTTPPDIDGRIGDVNYDAYDYDDDDNEALIVLLARQMIQVFCIGNTSIDIMEN